MELTTFYSISAFVFGAIFGSFLNVCIHRLPREESIVFPPSRCPFCRSKIAFYDNIPLVSYMVLSARCRHCGVHIPLKYFLVEAVSALCALLLFHLYGLSPLFFIYFFFVASLIVISVIDIEHRIIPNTVSIPGTLIGIILAFLFSHSSIPWPVTFKEALIGSLAGAGSLLAVGVIYTMITAREGIGLGDVKLLAMFGAFFGWRGVVFAVIIGSLLGLVFSLPLIALKKASLRYPIPFGPFLSLGLIIYWAFRGYLTAVF